ncbi:MAG: peptidoglycan bridge formation glycyltransferase FemA/FemB family protein [Chloroflexia bacterium]
MTTAAATNQRTLSARTVGPGESAEWDDFVSAHRAGHLLQSWAWGEFKSEYGWRPYRVAVTDSDGYVAAAQVLIRSVSGLSLAYVPRGPVASADDPEAYETPPGRSPAGQAATRLLLKIEPNETTPYSGPPSLLRRRGFIRSTHTVQARATLMLDLEGGRGASAQMAARPATTSASPSVAA